MASVIKNQVVKHLSKFAKNLSPDKIQLSTLKGEGELKNLELNEAVLMELLELPTWLRLRRAVCNRVSIKIQFSKLKSQPVRLYLDEVLVDMETCEDLRQPGGIAGLPSYSSGGRYSFGDRVVDGMYLHINSVVVSFTSKAFKAELQISRIIVQSKTPTWRDASDLRQTRISEKHRDLLLTFKEVEWQTIRIEANCMVQESASSSAKHPAAAVSTPLRFIANQAKVRISVKKRYSDCSVVASKVQLLMDDLLWILTDSQMKAAFVFIKYLKSNIDKAAEQSKQIAEKLLQKEHQSQPLKPGLASPATALFNKFDVQESSLHFQSSRIDFHICDDINSIDPNRKRQVDGGALGIALMKLCIDHYPVRAAGSSRQHWAGYDECMSKRDFWAQSLLGAYSDLLRRLQQQQPSPRSANGAGGSHAAALSTAAYANLIERSIVLRLEDFFITTVSLEKIDERRPKKLLASDKKALLLPKEMSSIHVEFTEYFFSKDNGLPVPSANVFVQVNPVVLVVDITTILWINSFALGLLHDVESIVEELSMGEAAKKSAAKLVKLEMLMPKIILPVFIPQHSSPTTSESTSFGAQHGVHSGDAREPTAVQLQISLLTITNAFCPDASTSNPARKDFDSVLSLPDGATDLAAAYSNLHIVKHSSRFPSDATDAPLLRNELWKDVVAGAQRISTQASQPTKSGPTAAELWLLSVDQAWLEFTAGGPGSSTGRPSSFMESVPFTAWMSVPPAQPADAEPHPKERRIDIVAKVGAKICAQLSPAQCGFLLKLADSLELLKGDLKREVDAHLSRSRPASPRDLRGEAAPQALVTLLLHLDEIEFAMVIPVDHGGCSVGSERLVAASASSTYLRTESDATAAGEDSSVKDENSCQFSPSSVPSDHVSHVSIGDACNNDGTLINDSDVTSRGTIRQYHDELAISCDVNSKVEAWRKPPSESAMSTKEARSVSMASSMGSLPSLSQAHVKMTSTFAKFTSRVKAAAITVTANAVVDEDDSLSDWDSVSVRSDDDAEFLMLNLEDEAPAFNAANQAGFVAEDASNISDMDSVVTEKQKRLVSIVLFKVCDIECGMEMKGSDVVGKVVVNHFVTSTIGCLPYDDFQSKHMAAQSVLEPVPQGASPRTAPPMLVRFAAGPSAVHPQLGPVEDGFASIAVADYAFTFALSTLDKLSSFADRMRGATLSSDTPPKPLVAEVCNVDVTIIKDDVNGAASTPSSQPQVIHVSKVSVTRSLGGAISIHGDTVTRPWPSEQRKQNAAFSDCSVVTDISGAMCDSDRPGSWTRTDPAPEEPLCYPGSVTVQHSTVGRSSDDSPAKQVLQEMGFLRKENDGLHSQIAAMETELVTLRSALAAANAQRNTAEEGVLNRHQGMNGESVQQLLREEAERWRQRVLESSAEADDARTERDCLLKTVRLLQDELTASEQRANAALAAATFATNEGVKSTHTGAAGLPKI